jgi:hypothetical protein
MSGLYNVLFGQHGNAGSVVADSGLTTEQIPRYRSCYWNGEHIVVHTRTGGGNREYSRMRIRVVTIPGVLRR